MARKHAGEPLGLRRQKRCHDPQVQMEEDSPPSPPQCELQPHHRPSKEPMCRCGKQATTKLLDCLIVVRLMRIWSSMRRLEDLDWFGLEMPYI